MKQVLHEGHRQRMIKRLEDAAQSLQDHELLEMLLFNAIPRKNTNHIAHQLLFTFGSLQGVFDASYRQLLTVEGIGPQTASFIKCVALLNQRMHFDENNFPEKFNFESYSKFLTERYKKLNYEVVEVFALDASERITACKRFTSKISDRASVDVKDLSEFIAVYRPKGVLVAHNHPASKCISSDADDAFTVKAKVLFTMNNVKFYDHLIVGTDGVFSYFVSRKLDVLNHTYDANKFLKETKIEESKKRY